jgi:ferredoxin
VLRAHNGHAVNLAQILPETIRHHNQADAINSAAILVPENRNRCPRSKSEETLSVAVRLFSKHGGQTKQTARECARTLLRGHELRIVPSLPRGGAKFLELQSRRNGRSFFKQPETPEEMAAAQRAMDVCPTLAIGNDG